MLLNIFLPILKYFHIFLSIYRREDDPDNAVDLEALTRYEDKNLGNFRRIYPKENEEKYQAFFENSCSLFQETAASKARSECARIQREEIKQKSQEIEIMRKKNGGKKVTVDGVRPESPRLGRKGLTRANRITYKRREFVSKFNSWLEIVFSHGPILFKAIRTPTKKFFARRTIKFLYIIGQ